VDEDDQTPFSETAEYNLDAFDAGLSKTVYCDQREIRDVEGAGVNL
jgi:hypothetical protein